MRFPETEPSVSGGQGSGNCCLSILGAFRLYHVRKHAHPAQGGRLHPASPRQHQGLLTRFTRRRHSTQYLSILGIVSCFHLKGAARFIKNWKSLPSFLHFRPLVGAKRPAVARSDSSDKSDSMSLSTAGKLSAPAGYWWGVESSVSQACSIGVNNRQDTSTSSCLVKRVWSPAIQSRSNLW